jgi:type IV pilus assembly protein PilQ
MNNSRRKSADMSSDNHQVGISRQLALMIFVSVFLAGCAAKEIEKKDPFMEEWRVRAEKAKGYSPTPKKRFIDLAPKRKRALTVKEPRIKPQKPLPAQKISLKMRNAEVATLLRALARAVDLSIMINESVKGKIDIDVKKEPWDQVFRGILNSYGLSYAWEGRILRIVSLEDIAVSLKQLEADQKIKSKQREIQTVEPPVTRVIDIDYGDAKSLKSNLENFLSKDDNGKPIGSVLVDEHTNAIIIQALESDIDQMIPLIVELDRPTPQIRIEAHLVEATRDTARDLGIQWGGLSKHGDVFITPGANTDGIFGQKLDDGVDPSSGIVSNFPADLTGAGGSGLTIGFAVQKIGDYILAAQLSALQEEGKLNILSSPSITTLDNQEAKIESGEDIPYQTIAGLGTSSDIKIEYKKAVLTLKVTPHVIDGKTLKLDILTSKDEADFSRPVNGNPTIITREAETKVILFDGQTTVIGGLNQETTTEGESGVPWVMDIPGLGRLFRRDSKRNEMDELLIFITPHILQEFTTEENPLPAAPSARPTERQQ